MSKGQTQTPDHRSEVITPTYTVTRVFCPNGHNLLDICHTINGLAGIILDFRRPGGQLGRVVLSPTLGCFDREVLSGEFVNGEKLDLFCPHCHAPLDKIGTCSCLPQPQGNKGDFCLIYLTADIQPDETIAICNIVGCHNSSLRHAGEYFHLPAASPIH